MDPLAVPAEPALSAEALRQEHAALRQEHAALRQRIAEVEARLAEQEQLLAALRVRIKDLEDRLATESHHSSKPPASDGPAQRTRSLRQPSGRRPGGQPGHLGHTLRLVDQPNRVEYHRPLREDCAACGASLAGGAARVGGERRQVVEHRVVQVTCPACGRAHQGAFPAGVTQPVQYGDRITAVELYLHDDQLLPDERTSEVLADLFGAAPAEGTLEAAERACAAGLATTAAALKVALQQAAVASSHDRGASVDAGRGSNEFPLTAPPLTLATSRPLLSCRCSLSRLN